MQDVSMGNGCAHNQPHHLGHMRCDVLAAVIGNPLFTKGEQLRANHNVHECECPQRLALWLRNVRREVQRREQASKALVRTAKQLAGGNADAPMNELSSLVRHPSLTRQEQACALLAVPCLNSKSVILSIVGRLYVKVLHRNGRLDEAYGYIDKPA